MLLPANGKKQRAAEEDPDTYAKGTKLSMIEDTGTVNEDDEQSETFSQEGGKVLENNMEKVPCLESFHQQSFKTE